jgi:hypothetical protein
MSTRNGSAVVPGSTRSARTGERLVADDVRATRGKEPPARHLDAERKPCAVKSLA